jgi:hypothetical protein
MCFVAVGFFFLTIFAVSAHLSFFVDEFHSAFAVTKFSWDDKIGWETHFIFLIIDYGKVLVLLLVVVIGIDSYNGYGVYEASYR